MKIDRGELLRGVFRDALALCDPAVLTGAQLSRAGNELRIGRPLLEGAPPRVIAAPPSQSQPLENTPLTLIAAGKAAMGQASALADVLGERVERALVVTPHGYPRALLPAHYDVCFAEHPLAGAGSLTAGERALELARTVPRDGVLVCAISGGASALLEAPVNGVELADIGRAVAMLMDSGASIAEINALRKHLSRIKGGRLAAAARGPTLTFILSDIVGDPLHWVGSGPTRPDPSSFADAYGALEKYALTEHAPEAVTAHLRRGMKGEYDDTPKPGDARLRLSRAFLTAGPGFFAEAAMRFIQAQGINAVLGPAAARTDVVSMAREIAACADTKVSTPTAFMWVREPTVCIDARDVGRGGRNSHLALLVARELRGRTDVAFISAAGDGIDGNSDAAGAVVDGAAWDDAVASGRDPRDVLARYDSAGLFAALGCALRPGPTGNNLLDLQILLLEPPAAGL